MASAQNSCLYGGLGRSSQRGPEAPLKLKTFYVLVPNGSTKIASFSVLCKLPKPQVIVSESCQKTEVSSTMAWTSTERDFELQCADTQYCKFQDGHFELNVQKCNVRVSEAPNHDRPRPPPPEKTHRICINLGNDVTPGKSGVDMSTPWRRPWTPVTPHHFFLTTHTLTVERAFIRHRSAFFLHFNLPTNLN